MSEFTWICGIDFGSTNAVFSLARVHPDTGRVDYDSMNVYPISTVDLRMNIATNQSSDVTVRVGHYVATGEGFRFNQDDVVIGDAIPAGFRLETGKYLVTFHGYKRVMYERLGSNPSTIMVEGSDGKRYPLDAVFGAFMRGFKTAFARVFGAMFKGARKPAVKFALTVPAMAGSQQDDFMKIKFAEVMGEAPVVQDLNFERANVFIVREPVAGARCVAETQAGTGAATLIRPNAVLMLLDVGGGTFDTSLARLSSGGERTDILSRPMGGAMGGSSIDEEVARLLRAILGSILDNPRNAIVLKEVIDLFTATKAGTTGPFTVDLGKFEATADEVRSLFGRLETAIGASDSCRDLAGCIVIRDLFDTVVSTADEFVELVGEAEDSLDDLSLVFSRELIDRMTEKVIDRVQQRAEEAYAVYSQEASRARADGGSGRIDGIICFGGFAESAALQTKLAAWAAPKRVQFCVALHPSICVVRGAASTALQMSDDSRIRFANSTVGYMVWIPYEAGMPIPPIATQMVEGTRYATNTARVIMRGGRQQLGVFSYEEDGLSIPRGTVVSFKFFAFPDDSSVPQPVPLDRDYRCLTTATVDDATGDPAPFAVYRHDFGRFPPDSTFKLRARYTDCMRMEIAMSGTDDWREFTPLRPPGRARPAE